VRKSLAIDALRVGKKGSNANGERNSRPIKSISKKEYLKTEKDMGSGLRKGRSIEEKKAAN